jgi:hypothetical protein
MTTFFLPKKSSIHSIGAIAAGIAVAMTPAAHAAITTFDLTSPSAQSSSPPRTLGPVGVDNLILNISNPQGSNLPTNSLNTNNSGFCVFAAVGSSNGRCALAQGSGAVLNGFSLSFNKSVYLRRFDITGLQNIAVGGITYGSEAFSFTANGTQTFVNPFLVSAGSTILVATSGSGLVNGSGVFRINNLQVELAPPVPGPLPLLGAGVAFAYSRKLRTRILKKAS